MNDPGWDRDYINPNPFSAGKSQRDQREAEKSQQHHEGDQLVQADLGRSGDSSPGGRTLPTADVRQEVEEATNGLLEDSSSEDENHSADIKPTNFSQSSASRYSQPPSKSSIKYPPTKSNSFSSNLRKSFSAQPVRIHSPTSPPIGRSVPTDKVELAINGRTHTRRDGFPSFHQAPVIPDMTVEAMPALKLPPKEFNEDPYQHVEFLGNGAYGYVDKVKKLDQPSVVFARKIIRITTGRNRDVQLRSVEREFEILSRLKHHHVISVLQMYSFKRKLCIIMSTVADMDMKEYLEKLDMLDTGPERHEMMKPLLKWQGCLIQAIDYLHEMKIKHKDLKPANILVKDGHVLIADFGIAKDLIDEETTASLTGGGARGSLMYMAPEIVDDGRRGRAVDIFSLGCIFLEISTCLIAGPGSRAKFANHRDVNGSRAFANCPTEILQWFSFLWGLHAAYNVFHTWAPDYAHDARFIKGHALPGAEAFLMLDPNPKTRITSRQLTQVTHGPDDFLGPNYLEACEACWNGGMDRMRGPTYLPMHSSFKTERNIQFPQPPEVALSSKLNLDWEGAKRLWLASHMWW